MTAETNNENLKKFFNPKEYITKLIGREEGDTSAQAEDNKEVELITTLLTDLKHKDVKEQTLLMLKKDKKEQLLLMAIAKQKENNFRHQLIAACWESEINFSKYLPFFVMLVDDSDYLVSLEAITVIQEMSGPFDKTQLSQALENVKKAKQMATTEKQVLLNDLLDTLHGFLNKTHEV